MTTRTAHAVVSACLMLCGAMGVEGAAISPNQLVVFGDSLSDNGNAFLGTGGKGVPVNDAAAVYNGVPVRYFTDGPNTTPATAGPTGLWVDQLAPKLGVADPAPYLSNPATATNYAVGSAETGSNGSFFVADQLALYSAVHHGMASPNALYTFWAGANDIADSKSPKAAADNIMSYIEGLGAEGAKNFLWLNLPLLGETPAASALNKVKPGTAALLNLASLAFDSEWQTDLVTLHNLGLNVIGVDVYHLFLTVQEDNAAGCTVALTDPLCFANVSAPAQGQNVDPNTFLYWDTEHPTTAADALIANLAFQSIQVAPEPATAGLVCIAGLAVIAGRRRRRNQTANALDDLGV